MAVIIRPAEQGDFEKVYDLVNELEGKVFDKLIQAAIYQENISNSRNIYLVATLDTQVVGFLSCHVELQLHHAGKVGEIVEMIIKNEHRNQGIGEQLINGVCQIAKEKELVLLEVTSNNKREAAHRFYKRVGFEQSHKKFTFLV